jgi:hypothetical protein
MTAGGNGGTFIQLHMPRDDFIRVFSSIATHNKYKGTACIPKRTFNGEGEEDTLVDYCTVSPKYLSVIT